MAVGGVGHLQPAVKRREAQSKGEKERYKHLNAEFQRIARRDKKAFFTIQLSHPYMTTGKTIALTKMDLSWQSNVSAFEYTI